MLTGKLYQIILGSCFIALSLFTACSYAEDQPNILFIYLDDFGWRDASYMGSDFYETPNIDALARGGMIFSDAYSCAANCAPARACLLSGQYTPRHQLFNVGTAPRGKARHRRLKHVPGTDTLNPEIEIWAEALQKSGYRTGMFGKWHLGTDPTTQGFDVAVEYDKLPGFNAHYGPEGQYLADVLTDQAVDFIKKSGDKRWCVYLSHFAVHTPLQPKRELLPKYQAKKPGKLHQNVKMATMIQAVDDGVGRIMTVLDEINARENTVILFYSDNGGYGPATDMDPLWGYKGTYFEGGIRVPFFVNWSGVVEPGTESSEPIIGVDLFPTICEIAGVRLPHQPLDGRSLIPLLKGELKSFGDRPLFWHFPAYLQSYGVYNEQRDPLFRSRPVSVVRIGDYKLKEYFEDGHVSLFNLRQDIRERHNLTKEMPEKRDELLHILKTWQHEVNAPVPTELNPKFDADAENKAIKKASNSRGKQRQKDL
ncbi:sulfatase [Bythopirellula goksoeyrii]|uniref:Arylsulfatase n=1 Tax=Bythopirellula goksoeyrii TaxID=1400387 RepID=A0A5B9Q8K9_9BACT|nr:sulfatase [Bythopirellula goksoeyrii]QEG35238.1 Arylsulfatase [Bythopirellula goksoeyrii]